jgi:3-dehydroquinate dehydratase
MSLQLCIRLLVSLQDLNREDELFLPWQQQLFIYIISKEIGENIDLIDIAFNIRRYKAPLHCIIKFNRKNRRIMNSLHSFDDREFINIP